MTSRGGDNDAGHMLLRLILGNDKEIWNDWRQNCGDWNDWRRGKSARRFTEQGASDVDQANGLAEAIQTKVTQLLETAEAF